jgi:hypothetical protein
VSTPAPALTLYDIRSRATLTVPEAGRVLGLSRNGAYDAAARGDFPVIRIGSRVIVPAPAFLALLGATAE